MAAHLMSFLVDEKSGVKEIIIEVLSEDHPATAKKLYNIVKKGYRKQVSYQAVHKALNELLKENSIVKQKKKYSLNRDYIRNLSYFVKKLEMNYENTLKLPENDFSIKKLNSQYEMALFLLGIMKTARKDDIITIVWPVVWPGFKTPEIYGALKEIGKKTETYCVCSSDGFLDRYFAKYWRRLGMNLRLGVNIETIFEVFAIKDMVILVYQPSDVRVRKHRYTSFMKSVTELEMDRIFLKVIKEKTEIYAFVIRNPMFAERIRQEIVNYF